MNTEYSVIIRPMLDLIPRLIEKNIRQALARGKSVLLLGPRQTGKTTLITQVIKPDLSYSFVQARTRQRYESDPVLFEKELEERIKTFTKLPIIFIDEIQKIPSIINVAQHLIDTQQAQFILTGSSARKLKHGQDLNLLPGRVVALTMSPLLYAEFPYPKPPLEQLLLYGSLPGIYGETDLSAKETDLYSYASTYVEEEIRAEALVRNVGNFARFLELAAAESGKQLNFSRLSQDIGIADTTIANYYQILHDCMITLRVDPLIKGQTRRRLIKSPKYLFFDLGIRRICANEGVRLPQSILGHLFEHFVGNELSYYSQLISPSIKLRYWRDSNGPEVDYVLDIAQTYIVVEVKWTERPTEKDAKNIVKFLSEYPNAKQAYIVCRSPHRYKVTDKVMAIPWQELQALVAEVQQ
ncbi:MAG: ATP-binding protein [Gammaproteobacteria bacterium]